MGLNISVKKIVNKTTEEDWNGELVPYYELEDQKWFDHLRFSGDKEFVVENEFVFYDDSNEEGREYVRPKDFEKCREWVNKYIPNGNSLRLLKALDELEKDENLVFRWSW